MALRSYNLLFENNLNFDATTNANLRPIIQPRQTLSDVKSASELAERGSRCGESSSEAEVTTDVSHS